MTRICRRVACRSRNYKLKIMNELRKAMMIRRRKVCRDVLSGAMSSETELANRYGVSWSTIRNDLLSIAEMIAMEMEESLPNEWAIAVHRFEANALRALNAFEESRRKQRKCIPCAGTGWVKSQQPRSKGREPKKTKCPKKFLMMAWSDGRVWEHRLVVARELDRCLKEEEVVHHIDMDEENNKPTNLALFKNDDDHRLFHDGIRVAIVWAGTPGIRPIVAKEWCDDCDGTGWRWYNVAGNAQFLAEYRKNIQERATLLGLYPKKGPEQQHLHFHEGPKGKIDVEHMSSETILNARVFQDKLEQHQRLIENKPVEVEVEPEKPENEEDKT